MHNQKNLPNATIVLVLGILSIVFSFYCGIGAITGAIGLWLAKKDQELYNLSPSIYSDYGNLKAGKTMSIIGLIIGILGLIFWILYFFFFFFYGVAVVSLM